MINSQKKPAAAKARTRLLPGPELHEEDQTSSALARAIASEMKRLAGPRE